MNPTAPNNSKPQDPNVPPPNPPTGGGTSPQSTIQPGQFAVAGEDGVFKEPPAPAAPQPLAEPAPVPQNPTPQPAAPQPESPVAMQQAPSYSENQPNPTPYAPPQEQGVPENSSPSGIRKMRLVIMVAGLLLLVVLIAALAWFLVFSKNNNAPEKVQTDENKIELPTTPPQRTTGGFSEIPPATGGASPATPAALPQ